MLVALPEVLGSIPYPAARTHLQLQIQRELMSSFVPRRHTHDIHDTHTHIKKN